MPAFFVKFCAPCLVSYTCRIHKNFACCRWCCSLIFTVVCYSSLTHVRFAVYFGLTGHHLSGLKPRREGRLARSCSCIPMCFLFLYFRRSYCF